MSRFTRRDALIIGAGVAAGAAVGAGGGLGAAQAQATPELKLTPEKGAVLRVLRPAKFVQGDETLFLENTEKYVKQTGVKVTVDSVGFEDLRPKAAVAANVGKGPDIVYGWYDDAHQYPDKLVDVTDVAEYLGKKYGGWYPIAEKFGKRGNRWVCLPLGAAGAKMVYRISWAKDAGFDGVPGDMAGFLKLCQGLKAKGYPPGFALGNAVGDGNTWCHWVVWAFGGKMVNEKDQVVINSPETVAALEYAKQLYETFIPGTLSWLDPSNNKAFLDGQISLTNNGISIYYAAKNSSDPTIKALAADIGHGNFPVGPVGKPTELHLTVPAMVFKYSKYKNAAKDYVRFMFEREQYVPWQQASIGYWSQPLRAYEQSPIWTDDPKHTPYRDIMKNMLWPSYAGSLGYASAATLADYIMVNMVAVACSGTKTPKEAATEAQRRAERYYKV
ncbi:MAG: carbohydrate ABC transporter substrate-binding protein [Rhodospirillales bacterium]|nr:carbohydrate ABC transporter substrate-binding protein [Rhodospirillales bacterium]